MNRQQFIIHAEACQKALRRFLTALCCGDSQLADDIAQEALIKAYLSSEGFLNADSFNAWIYRIAYNAFLDHQRSRKQTVGYEDAKAIESDNQSDNAFRYQELYASLDRLSAKERSAILLFYMEGYSVKEISVITESSEGAVKQYLSRGRSHLRNLMESHRN